ncbi:MAG: T9SS type A sorting domain-containing protein [Chitinophagales bacterium]
MKKILLLFVTLQIAKFSFCQTHVFNTTATDDYKNVSTQLFVTAPALATNDEGKYLISSMRIAENLRSVFNEPYPAFVWPPTQETQEFLAGYTTRYYGGNSTNSQKYIMYKLNNGYTNWNATNQDLALDIVVIRPNDNLTRPCIMLTNGNGENFRTQWAGSLYTAATLVMRGYAVAIYENAAAGDPLSVALRGTASSNGGYNFPVDYFSSFYNSLDSADKYRPLLYGSVQCGVAALQYLTNSASVLKINMSKIYAAGGSWGGLSSTAFTYADDDASLGNVNFNNSFFTANYANGGLGMGNFKRISRWPNAAYKNIIKSVACLGGGASFNDPKIGNIFDSQDNAPVLFMHANNDAFVDIETGGPTVPTLIRPYLGGPANSTLLKAINDQNIKFNTYINCDSKSEHVFVSGFGDNGGFISDLVNYTDQQIIEYSNITAHPDASMIADNQPNTADITYAKFRAKVKRYIYVGLQVLDMSTYIGDFLVRSTNNQVTTNIVKYVRPIDYYARAATPNANDDYFLFSYPNWTIPNGHYENHPTPCRTIQILGSSPISQSTLRKATLITTPTETKAISLPVLYPNPTTGKLNINLQLENEINGYAVNIFSADGRTVYNKSIADKMEATQTLQQNLDISEQPNGIYFVRITSENKVLLTKTFVLNK